VKVLAIIPARSGSKSIKNKNIRKINGKPLLAYSIEHALESSFINRVIVSTDSLKYGNIARKYGAEFPFTRPADISGDLATDLLVFEHALDWLQINESYIPDILVHLRPTCPIRKVSDIDNMIEILMNDPAIDSVRSVVLAPDTPYKMWFRNDSGLIMPAINSTTKEAYNQPRQSLPAAYLQNASVDVIRTNTITEKHSMTGDRIYGYVMDHNWDIDYLSQLRIARKNL
jgi:CMP-N,N'-diacetyllegionaminic acid synthase